MIEVRSLKTKEVGELAKEVRKTENNLTVDINKDYMFNGNV